MTGFDPHRSDGLGINTIRTLAADVVGKANSGHPVSNTGAVPCIVPWPRLLSTSKPQFLMRLF